jgi:predicted transcriptional regulator
MTFIAQIMTVSTPLDDVEFLARSAHRVKVLRTLGSGAWNRPDLHHETDIPQPTLGRILGSFEDRNWIERQSPEYALTSLGELIVEAFEDLLETVETVQLLGDVVVQLPTDEMDFDLREFADATIHMPEPGDTLSHVRRMEAVWFEADQTRLLGSTLGPASFEDRKAHAREFFDDKAQIQVETIVSAAMLEKGMSDPELRRMTREHWDSDRMRSYLYDGPIPLILAIADGVTMLAPTDENGIPTAVIETENETIRSWAESQLDEYRERSIELTVDDIPPVDSSDG